MTPQPPGRTISLEPTIDWDDTGDPPGWSVAGDNPATDQVPLVVKGSSRARVERILTRAFAAHGWPAITIRETARARGRDDRGRPKARAGEATASAVGQDASIQAV